MTPKEAEQAIKKAAQEIEQLTVQIEKLTKAFELLAGKVAALEKGLPSSPRLGS
jgi:predicted  nucleic acid-binding Zn-ribbon protein